MMFERDSSALSRARKLIRRRYADEALARSKFVVLLFYSSYAAKYDYYASSSDECVRLLLSVRIVHVIPAPQSGTRRLHPLMASGKVKSSCSGDYLEGRLQST